MLNDAPDGTSPNELTVTDAAPAFEAYLSSIDEDQEEPQANPTQDSPESDPETEDEASTEPAAAVEEPESDEPAAESEEAAEESQPTAELDPNLLVKVKVDGIEETIPLAEALKGYSRTKDYTQKTQAHAEKVRAFESETQKVVGERQLYAQRLTQLEQAIVDATPQEPDWDKVQQDSPEQFANLRAQWSLHKERLGALQAERERAQQAVQADQAATHQRYLNAEQEQLHAALPEFADPEKGKTVRAEMVAYIEGMGYSNEQIAGLTDHRVIVMLNKAMKYDAMQKRKPEIKNRIEVVKTATPGPAKGSKPAVSKYEQARQRLAKTGGTNEAGVAAFEAFLEASE